ncbi:hypothetical protein PG996_004266 [Apiospora saccharicola]|uniref:2EXR domain-containing protein n=1 Tax=Apiospora saccharicola TaxID=335842 RepID=A0ABR1W6E3_9PEZI
MPVYEFESFHAFSRLPKELQLLIWEIAASEPQVHHATLARETASPPAVPSRGRRREYSMFEYDLMQDDATPSCAQTRPLWPPLDAMLRTSQDSRAVAQRVLESSHSVLLRPEFKASLDRGGLPTLRVRPMVDLVILNAGWPDQLDMRRRIISYRQVQDVPQLRCLGVPCISMASDISTVRPTLDTEWFGKFVNVIKGLRTVYWGLRVLYITVEPEQLGASVGPQWPETQRGFQSDFLDAYEKGPPARPLLRPRWCEGVL